MSAVDAVNVSYRYGNTIALDGLDLSVPTGSVYALLGPNGSGKTTLMQILAGLRRAQSGQVNVLRSSVNALTLVQRARFTYVAENQTLPAWMRLEQLEAYLAPLYASWDFQLASELRERFALDPKRKLGTLSRGTAMKASLLCALAPRPELLLMDEPFTGMDAVVKDELVRGLLETAGRDGWTVLVCSHDIAEVEMLADWVGLLQHGRMTMSETMESLHTRFKYVEVVNAACPQSVLPAHAMQYDVSGTRTSFLVTQAIDGYDAADVRLQLPSDAHVTVKDASLRDVFVALSARPRIADRDSQSAGGSAS